MKQYEEINFATNTLSDLKDLKEIVAALDYKKGKERNLLVQKAAHTTIHLITNDPNNPEIYFYAGEICLKQKNNQKAIEHFKKAIEIDSSYQMAWVHLGKTFLVMENYPEALKYLEKAHSLDPTNIICRLYLSDSYFGNNQEDKAKEILDEIIIDFPDYADAYYLQGIFDQSLGRFEKAREKFKKVLKLQPERLEAYYQLTQMNAFNGQEKNVEQIIRRKMESNKYTDNLKILGKFAIARLCEQQNKYDEAYNAYYKANELIKKTQNYKLTYFEQLAENSFKTFTKEITGRPNRYGSLSERKIFIVGVMRSGTTLLEQMLGRHPDICPAGELTKIPEIVRQLTSRDVNIGTYPQLVNGLSTQDLMWASDTYLEFTDNITNTKEGFTTDKLPLNIFHIGLILTIFPNSKIIHCVRNPIDTCLSCYFQNFTNHTNAMISCDLKRLAAFYKLNMRLSDHWNSVFSKNIIDVQYENVVQDPEKELRKIIKHVGLDWDGDCLTHIENNNVVKTASQWQVRQPINRHSVKKWKNYEPYISELIEEFKDYI